MELRQRALAVLCTPDPVAKAAQARELGALADSLAIAASAPTASAPLPGRPARPELIHPAKVARRSPAKPEGLAALLHAIAHIEFNAINLALDAAWRFDAMPREFYLDWGLSHLSSGGESLTGFIGTLNYQFGLGTGRGSTEPYLTLGLGLTYLREHTQNFFSGSETISGTNPLFGGGIGVRHRVGRNHGALRGEVRYDRLAEGSGDLGLASANAVSVKLGFDLWMR